MPAGSRSALVALALTASIAAPSASAATLAVDDDAADCPSAPYATIQAAVDAAAPGDTVAVCPGTYVEGTGEVGSNALTITRPLTLKGAGADLVMILPRRTVTPDPGAPAPLGQIAATVPDLRDGVGNVITVLGSPETPIAVSISGVTVNGNRVYSEAGIAYVDASGSVSRSRVTRIVTSEVAAAEAQPGGYRSGSAGYGIVQTTAGTGMAGVPVRELALTSLRIDKYNRGGVLIDAATGDVEPLVASGVPNRGVVLASQIVGRTQCIDFEATGDCSVLGTLTTGTLYGQDGIRVTAGASASVGDTLLSQNLVNGSGAPVRPTTSTPDATGNANLVLGAGLRLLGAAASSITRSNIVDNAYGVINQPADPLDPTPPAAVGAEDNWWGLRGFGSNPTNSGPAISPSTNPPVPENPVNGAPVADGIGTSSTLVDVFPFRAGQRADPGTGQYPILDAPLPVSDTAPTAALAADETVVARGQDFTLTATAGDDFGVKKVTFLAGATVLATDGTAPYATTLALGPSAACGDHVYGVLVEDSLGQTASASTTVTLDCPPDPEPTPTPTPTPEPTVEPTPDPTVEPTPAPTATPGPAPTATPVPPSAPAITLPAPVTTALGAGGTVVSLTPPAGTTKVEVLIGGRLVCTLVRAPWSCRILPTGADVGAQTIRIVAYGAGGQVLAELGAPTRVTTFATRRLSIGVKSRRLKGGKVRKTVTATVVRPSRVTAAQGCRGTITLVLRRNGVSIGNEQLKVGTRTCRVTRSFTTTKPKKAKRFSASARFGGNAVLRPISSSRRFS